MNRVEGPYQSRSPAPPSKCFMTPVISGGLRVKAQGRGEDRDAVGATLYSNFTAHSSFVAPHSRCHNRK